MSRANVIYPALPIASIKLFLRIPGLHLLKNNVLSIVSSDSQEAEMIKVAFCDWIANIVHKALVSKPEEFAPAACKQLAVTRPQLDLDSDGFFTSTKKTIIVKDSNDTFYKITVEQVEMEYCSL